MTIYDGGSNASPIFGSYCRNHDIEQISSSNEVLLHFQTKVGGYWGFYVQYNGINDTLNCNFQSVEDGCCKDESLSSDACCVSKQGDNSNYCSACNECSGVLASPGFPSNYDTYIDLSWLIKVPQGQLIELVFLTFDMDYSWGCK